jgi:radical SAM superfamily enzyme YgiQ (UPF0313 family)
MRICFVYPNSFNLPKAFRLAISNEPYLLPPLGVLSVIANSKFDIDFIDNRVKKYGYRQLLDFLSFYEVVGFGGTIFEVKEARRLSHALMARGVKTIYGGANATMNSQYYKNDFSMIYRGEGEVEFDEAVYLGASVYTAKRIVDFSNIKFPARHKINLDKYIRKEPKYMSAYPLDTIASSRGCPFDCSFCASLLMWNRKWVPREIDHVIDEMRFMQETLGTKGFYFREDNFTVNNKRLLGFCEAVKPLKTEWMAESRIDTINDNVLSKMAESGCRALWFGIESTVSEIQKTIDKTLSLDMIRESLTLCKKHGIRTGGSFMIGLPNDTKETIMRNIKESKTLGLDHVFYNRVHSIPGTRMYREIIDNDLDDYSKENIIIPSTYYLSANKVNRLFYRKTGKWKAIIKKRLRDFSPI